MTTYRDAAVAGTFYPADPETLRADIRRYLSACAVGSAAPKALIVPHAGFIYSGPVAAHAYARLGAARNIIRRVVLIGPSHFVALSGLAVPAAEAFRSPLGPVALDREAIGRLCGLAYASVFEAAHVREQSLEVQLPFLQLSLDRFALVPLVAGDVSTEAVAEVIELLWGGPETLIVVSSDLSHYLDYDTAHRRDAATAQAIMGNMPERLGPEDACGYAGIRGLLAVARQRGLRVEAIDVRSSGDTAGSRDCVVGYGAFSIEEPPIGRRI